jgi:hypothetical protein
MGLRHRAPRAGLFLRRSLLKRHVFPQDICCAAMDARQPSSVPADRAEPRASMDIADLIERNAPFAADRRGGAALTYAYPVRR